MSVAIERQESRSERRRRTERKDSKSKHKIFARYRYDTLKFIETDDYGSFREMWAKYKDTHEFYCADLPPTKTDTGAWDGFHLTASNLKDYGSHKAWIEHGMTVDGKPVILVFNAGLKCRFGLHNWSEVATHRTNQSCMCMVTEFQCSICWKRKSEIQFCPRHSCPCHPPFYLFRYYY